jgi:hypothetical protein
MLHRTSKNVWRAGLAAAAVAAVSTGCASKTQTSGETHFVYCDSDAVCASLGAEYSCQANKCQIRSETDAGAGGTAGSGGNGQTGGAGAGNGGAGSASCGANCTAAYGYPIFGTNGVGNNCVDTSKKEILGCYCPGAPNMPGLPCHVRKSDGSVWLGEFTSLADPGAFDSCASLPADPYECDFTGCLSFLQPPNPSPPPSWCSLEDTCKSLGCGSLEFDANGCKRPECTSDADCSSADRCIHVACRNTMACTYSADGNCLCGGPTPCFEAQFCNPTAETGPRGDWTALEFTQASGPCPTPGGCTSTWRLTPDGSLAMSKDGTPSTATVDAADLTAIVAFINGPELRPALRDGFQCDPPPTDVGWQVKLELSTQTLQQDATGCLTTGPAGNIAQQVFDYVKKY